MNSTTVKMNSRHFGHTANTDWATRFAGWIDSVKTFVFVPKSPESDTAESVRRLLELADSYDETQPSYASDLRAAAMAFDQRSGGRSSIVGR